MPLIILDRDGVINEDSDAFVKSVEEFIPIPGSIDAIARLSRAGYTVVVATNQSGLGRGLFDLDDLEAMHQFLTEQVEAAGGELGGIFYCPHTPEDACDCRKPKAGLLDAIAAEIGQPLDGAPLVGDSQRDLEAGLARGCQPMLVLTGKGAGTAEKFRADPGRWGNVPIFANLAAAVDALLQGTP